MSAKKDKRTLNLIIFMTGVLFFALVIGIVIFSLPNTTDKDENSTNTAKLDTTTAAQTLATTEIQTTEETTIIETTTEEPTTEAPKTISLVAFGDNLLHSGIFDWVRQEDGSYDMTHAYEGIREMAQNADIAMINEEVVIGGEELGLVKYPNFNAVYEVADELHNIGMDCLTTATNHTLDMGAAGVNNMLAYMSEHYPEMLLTGAYNSQEARDQVPLIEREGIKLAVLSYTYDLNGHSSSEIIVNMIDPELITADIAKANEVADFVIVAMHWGEEYSLQENQQQTELAQIIADAGADLIIGTHPHVVEPVKVIKASDGRDVVCYYSLGNLVSLQNRTASLLGGIAEVQITKTEEGTSITDYNLDFVVTHYNFDYEGCTTVLWKDYSEERAALHGAINFDETFSYSALKNIMDNALQMSEGL